MKREIEVEEKYDVKDSELLIAHLNASDFLFEGEGSQTDIYFVDKKRKYLKDNTCLRIRLSSVSDKATIDYKGPTKDLADNVISKIETNVQVDKKSIEHLAEMLDALGCPKYVSVEKVRKSWVRNLELGSFRVTVDSVKHAGVFVEIELTAPADTEEKLVRGIWEEQIKDMVGFLGNPVRLPYRDLVANSIGA